MLTSENYFSRENQMAYMGASQFKAFQKCEAAALAEIRGEYVRPSSPSMLVGSYVDAHFEDTLHIFKAQHPELFKRDGGLKSDYLNANDIIARMEADELYMLLMSGRKQVIKTGTIAGVPFKIKIDSLLDADTCKKIAEKFPNTAAALGMCDGAIIDQKVMKDVEPVWSPEEHRKLPFVEFWGYDLQGAIYQAVEGNQLPFVLAVGTTQDDADLQALFIDDDDLKAKLYEIEDLVPRFQATKEGKIEPKRCGNCAYCRRTKHLSGIINYKELSADAE